MSGGGSTYNYPQQPTYGEGMADAMKAQMEMLTGTGADFSKIYAEALPGVTDPALRDVLREFEAPLRRETAQIETDVMRQTLLGDEKVADEQGRVITGYEPAEGAPSVGEGVKYRKVAGHPGQQSSILIQGKERKIGDIDPQSGFKMTRLPDDPISLLAQERYETPSGVEVSGADILIDEGYLRVAPDDPFRPKVTQKAVDENISGRTGWPSETTGDWTSLTEYLVGNTPVEGAAGPPVPKYQTETDPDTGKEVVVDDAYLTAQGKPARGGQTIREGTGMVDLLGDRRGVQEAVRVEDYETFATGTPERRAAFEAENRRRREAGISDWTPQEWGKAHYDNMVAQGRGAEADEELTQTTILRDAGRQAGFDPQGQFLGLAAMAEDVGRGVQQRAQEDVVSSFEMYGPRATAAYRAQGDLQGALDAAKSLAPGGEDPLRTGLRRQAEEGLQEGLTERQKRNLREFTRSAAEARGRPRDIQAIMAESEAQMLEDQNLLARNRAFAQNVLGQEEASATRMVGLEQATLTDPLRPGANTLGAAQGVFGQAGYGLDSGPQYLNPEAGLGYISNRAANEAAMWGAGQAADAARYAGTMDMIGGLGSAAIGGWSPFGKKKTTPICWVAREVYGAHNPAWLDFREWMLLRAPSWFRALYVGYGERFAKFISDKPRLKARIRGWMDTKIGRA